MPMPAEHCGSWAGPCTAGPSRGAQFLGSTLSNATSRCVQAAGLGPWRSIFSWGAVAVPAVLHVSPAVLAKGDTGQCPANTHLQAGAERLGKGFSALAFNFCLL